MLTLGSIAFAAPWLLVALAGLPLVWWLLRLAPPPPRRVRFPAVWLLRDLVAREETPARTPPWLLALRLAIAGLIIAGLAGPILHPQATLPGSGPLILVLDNGWAAARDWSERQSLLAGLLSRAERQRREVLLLTTAAEPSADPGGGKPALTGPLAAADARRLIQGLESRPWANDRAAALAALKGLTVSGAAHSVWLSDGLESADAEPLARHLQRLGSLEVVSAEPGALPHLLLPPQATAEGLTVPLVRAAPGPELSLPVRLSAGNGRLLALESARFAAGATQTEARFELPAELRNLAVRAQIEGEATVGATVLLDERWRRRPVGLASAGSPAETQPLLSDDHYLEKALAPFSEVRHGRIGELLARELSVLVLADTGPPGAEDLAALQAWLERGGVVLRFAGPRLAQTPDDLLPVRLRGGDRTLGGALSWSQPARLAAFDATSPFAGLAIPAEVTVTRQVLAEPTLEVADHTWARLADGTPLVTASRRGRGTLVLVHTTANPEWSNLALSGLFVEMLRRLTALAAGLAEPGRDATLAPLETLDSRGRLGLPPASALPVAAERFASRKPDPHHPPGFYGSAEQRLALNLTGELRSLRPLGPLPAGIGRSGFGAGGEIDLKPWLLALAGALLAADLALALWLRGLVGPAALLLLALLPLLIGPARADDAQALKAASQTWLGYIVTGDPAVDATSRAGLEGLAQVLTRRTAVEAAGAMAVEPERDDPVFFPLLYWPVTAGSRPLSSGARRRINDYLHHGGTILFDTRDGSGVAWAAGGAAALRQTAEGLDLPTLAPLPADHVLTRAFYLLQEFPGRTAGGTLWVEAQEDRRLDGVSSVIIGGADWAGAWAVDATGRPLHAAVPGGERQRELAYRFGVNLVMYALTGNYKADQVHVPAILERIGQ